MPLDMPLTHSKPWCPQKKPALFSYGGPTCRMLQMDRRCLLPLASGTLQPSLCVSSDAASFFGSSV